MGSSGPGPHATAHAAERQGLGPVGLVTIWRRDLASISPREKGSRFSGGSKKIGGPAVSRPGKGAEGPGYLQGMGE